MSRADALVAIVTAAGLFAVYGLTLRGRAAAPPRCGLCSTARGRLGSASEWAREHKAVASGAARVVPTTREDSVPDDEPKGGATWSSN